MFIPSDTQIPGLPSLAASNVTAAQASPPMPQPSPLLAHRSTFTTDYTGSDTQSVRSGRSLSSYASATVRHPDMHEPGLNSSIVETVSTWFESAQITKALVIGQVALAFNPPDLSSPFGTDTIRLENFPVLEKVAPNPAFLEQVPEKPGTYTVDLAKITKTSVAFHYQVHLDNTNIAVFSPVVISTAWKVEATQTSAIINYSLNSLLTLPAGTTSISLNNLIIVLRLDSSGAKATNAQSKPVGSFARERSLIYWRLGDVTLSTDQPAQQLRVRFFTEGEAKPGNAEARWEMSGDATKTLGSGLAVSKIVDSQVAEEKEKDPFADEAPEKSWSEVPAVKKICSGTYVATQ
jgi:F-BAR domain only protein